MMSSRSIISIDPGVVNFGICLRLNATWRTKVFTLLDYSGQTYKNFKKRYQGQYKGVLIKNMYRKLESFMPDEDGFNDCVIEGQFKSSISFIEGCIQSFFADKYPKTNVFTVAPRAVAKWFRPAYGVDWSDTRQKKLLAIQALKNGISNPTTNVTDHEADAFVNIQYAVYKYKNHGSFADGQYRAGDYRTL